MANHCQESSMSMKNYQKSKYDIGKLIYGIHIRPKQPTSSKKKM